MAESDIESLNIPRKCSEYVLDSTKIEQLCATLLGNCTFAPIEIFRPYLFTIGITRSETRASFFLLES